MVIKEEEEEETSSTTQRPLSHAPDVETSPVNNKETNNHTSESSSPSTTTPSKETTTTTTSSPSVGVVKRRVGKEKTQGDDELMRNLKELCKNADPTKIYLDMVKIGQG